VSLLLDSLGPLIARVGQPAATPRAIRVTTTSPERDFVLETGEPVRLAPADDSAADSTAPRLRLPAEALLRLVYGRLDSEHTPAVEADDVDVDDLRRMFPGF
jgi:hypothetical protein